MSKKTMRELIVIIFSIWIGWYFTYAFMSSRPITTPTPLTPSVTITITDGQADTLYTYREK